LGQRNHCHLDHLDSDVFFTIRIKANDDSL
jgi:hypothetical protein